MSSSTSSRPPSPDPEAAPSTTGTCFGFSAASDVHLDLLRPGTGQRLVVRETIAIAEPTSGHLLEWNVPGDDPLLVRLYHEEGCYTLEIGETARFYVDPREPRIDILPVPAGIVREERLWGLPALLCFLARGDLPIHAAAVELGDHAIAIGAPGRWGKTTLAAAFLTAGFRVLSEDVTCCRPGDPWLLLPGPAVLKLRREAYEHLEMRHVSVVTDEPERVHLRIDADARGTADPVPLRSVVLLAPGDDFSLERVPAADAMRMLWPLSFNLPLEADRVRCFGAIADLLTAVEVWQFTRPMRYECLPATIEHLARAFGA